MDLQTLAQQALAIKERRRKAVRLTARARELRASAASLAAQAEAETKRVAKRMSDSDETLQELVEEEKAAKQTPQYREAETSFNDIKTSLGITQMAKSKKARKEELKDMAEAEPEICQLVQRAKDAEAEAAALENQASVMEPEAEIIDALAAAAN